MNKALQIVAGVILGPLVVAALFRWLPIQSGLGVFVTSLVVTLAVAIGVALRFPNLRPGAVAFGVSATVINLLVGLVVVAI